jgi:hypothetical protein
MTDCIGPNRCGTCGGEYGEHEKGCEVGNQPRFTTKYQVLKWCILGWQCVIIVDTVKQTQAFMVSGTMNDYMVVKVEVMEHLK